LETKRSGSIIKECLILAVVLAVTLYVFHIMPSADQWFQFGATSHKASGESAIIW